MDQNGVIHVQGIPHMYNKLAVGSAARHCIS